MSHGNIHIPRFTNVGGDFSVKGVARGAMHTVAAKAKFAGRSVMQILNAVRPKRSSDRSAHFNKETPLVGRQVRVPEGTVFKKVDDPLQKLEVEATRSQALQMLKEQREMVKLHSGGDNQTMKFLDQVLKSTEEVIGKGSMEDLKKLMSSIAEENKSHAVKLHRIQPDHRLALDPDTLSCNELAADIKAQYSEQYVASPLNVVATKHDQLQALAAEGKDGAAEMLSVFSKDNKASLMDMKIGTLKTHMNTLKAFLPEAFEAPQADSGSRNISL